MEPLNLEVIGFGEYLAEVGIGVIFTHKGKNIIGTKHAVDRAIERNNLTPEEIEILFTKIIDRPIKKQGTYVFYVKSLKQGLVINYRPDNQVKSNVPQYVIITFLPRKKSQTADPNDVRIVLENSEYADVDEEFLIEIE